MIFYSAGVEEGVEGLHLRDDRGTFGPEAGEGAAAEEREPQDAESGGRPLPALEEQEGEVAAEGKREAREEAEGKAPGEAGRRAEGDPGEREEEEGAEDLDRRDDVGVAAREAAGERADQVVGGRVGGEADERGRSEEERDEESRERRGGELGADRSVVEVGRGEPGGREDACEALDARRDRGEAFGVRFAKERRLSRGGAAAAANRSSRPFLAVRRRRASRRPRRGRASPGRRPGAWRLSSATRSRSVSAFTAVRGGSPCSSSGIGSTVNGSATRRSAPLRKMSRAS